jgi:hypothetical protein
MNKANIQWSGKTLYNMVTKGKASFDNYVQRNKVWDNSRKSLFIHSLITGFPVPPFYAGKQGEQYDMLDGQQRSDALVSFMNDEFLLHLEEDYQEIILENGQICDLDGKKFSELPEELQDKVKDFSFTIYYFDDITDDEIEEMFFRLNNGKPLSPFDLVWAKTLSKKTIINLAKHELFSVALTAKALNNKADKQIIMHTYMMLYADKPSYTNKDVREVLTNVEITSEQAEQITKVFDKLLAVNKSIPKGSKSIIKRMLKKTHLVSLTRLAFELDENTLRNFVMNFFDAKGKAATVSDKYNLACQYGSAKPDSIATRMSEMKKYLTDVILEMEPEPVATGSMESDRIFDIIPKHKKTAKELAAEQSTDDLFEETETDLNKLSNDLDGLEKGDKEAAGA